MFDIATLVGGIGQIFGALKPVIADSIAQKYNNEQKERDEDFSNIMQMPEGQNKRDRIANHFDKLCNQAGHPVGSLSGRSIEVPLEYFVAVHECASHYINATEQLARVSIK